MIPPNTIPTKIKIPEHSQTLNKYFSKIFIFNQSRREGGGGSEEGGGERLGSVRESHVSVALDSSLRLFELLAIERLNG